MIEQKLKKIPITPGIYFFKNSVGEILYIGKAGNLRNRLASYFNKQKKEPRIQHMLNEATDVQWQELGSEIEALIVEAEQIKINQPRYNIIMRDGKQYSYVASSDDAFPRIYITHQPQENEIAIGPFVDGGALRSTLKLFRRIFPYCSCKQKHNNYCLNYHIGQCLGFCCLKNPTITDEQYQEYKNNIKAIKDLLHGARVTLVKELGKEMKAAAEEENFELAIELKNKLEKINYTFENAKVIKEIRNKQDVLAEIQKFLKLSGPPRRIEGYDIANIQGKHATGAMAVFTDGNPDKNEYRKFKIQSGNTPDDIKMLKEILRRRFNHPEWQYPDLIIIDGGKAQLNAAIATILVLSLKDWQLQGSTLKLPIIVLTKNDRHVGDHIYISGKKLPISLKRLPESVRNLILHIDEEAHKFAISYYRKLHRTAI